MCMQKKECFVSSSPSFQKVFLDLAEVQVSGEFFMKVAGIRGIKPHSKLKHHTRNPSYWRRREGVGERE